MELDMSRLEYLAPNWLEGPEGSRSTWGSLPHGLYGATPAGPCSRVRARSSMDQPEDRLCPPRFFKQASGGELRDALKAPLPLAASERSPIPTLKPGTASAEKRATRDVKRAAILDENQLHRVLEYIDLHSRSRESDRIKILLSFKAGLRAGEIAQLPISAFLGADGEIARFVDVSACISKSRSRRVLPLNRLLWAELEELRDRHPTATHVAFSLGRNGQIRRQNAGAVTHWMHRLYKNVGLTGCSSHSGRRTFATRLARALATNRSSLKDLQLLLGHQSLSSTESYLEPSENIVELIHAI